MAARGRGGRKAAAVLCVRSSVRGDEGWIGFCFVFCLFLVGGDQRWNEPESLTLKKISKLSYISCSHKLIK